MAATATDVETIVSDYQTDVFNTGDYSRLPDLMADDCVQHGPMSGEDVRGLDAIEGQLRGYHEAFPDLHAETDLVVSSDDHVVQYLTYSGTHDGEFMGIPATGEQATVNGIVINRIEDGKIAETWSSVDFLGVLAQTGAVDLPTAA